MNRLADQRRSLRMHCTLSATWTHQGRRVEVEVTDIGAHGLFVVTDEQTLPGALMQLDVELPDGQRPILLFAAARSVGLTASGRGIGAEIYVISNYDRERWNRLYRGQRGREVQPGGDPLRAIA
jgi:hypothetical protein